MPTYKPPADGSARAIEEARVRLGLTVGEMSSALGLSRQSLSIAMNSGRVSTVLELAVEGLSSRYERGREFAFVVRVTGRVPAVTLVRRPKTLNGAEAAVPDMTFLVRLECGKPEVSSIGPLSPISFGGREYFLLPAELLAASPLKTKTCNTIESGPVPPERAPPTDSPKVSRRDRLPVLSDTKHFLVVNDVLRLLPGQAQLRVPQIADLLEKAGIHWFDMTRPRARRLEQLQAILYNESRGVAPRVERVRAGYYRAVQATGVSADEPPEGTGKHA